LGLILLEKHLDFKYDFKQKEASGLRLFPRANGVQVVGGSNPCTPTLELNQREITGNRSYRPPEKMGLQARADHLNTTQVVLIEILLISKPPTW
jgi:hypothetical protein